MEEAVYDGLDWLVTTLDCGTHFRPIGGHKFLYVREVSPREYQYLLQVSQNHIACGSGINIDLFNVAKNKSIGRCSHKVTSLQMLREGHIMTAGNGRLKLWNMKMELLGSVSYRKEFEFDVKDFSTLNPDSGIVCAGYGWRVGMFNMEKEFLVKSFNFEKSMTQIQSTLLCTERSLVFSIGPLYTKNTNSAFVDLRSWKGVKQLQFQNELYLASRFLTSNHLAIVTAQNGRILLRGCDVRKLEGEGGGLDCVWESRPEASQFLDESCFNDSVVVRQGIDGKSFGISYPVKRCCKRLEIRSVEDGKVVESRSFPTRYGGDFIFFKNENKEKKLYPVDVEYKGYRDRYASDEDIHFQVNALIVKVESERKKRLLFQEQLERERRLPRGLHAPKKWTREVQNQLAVKRMLERREALEKMRKEAEKKRQENQEQNESDAIQFCVGMMDEIGNDRIWCLVRVIGNSGKRVRIPNYFFQDVSEEFLEEDEKTVLSEETKAVILEVSSFELDDVIEEEEVWRILYFGRFGSVVKDIETLCKYCLFFAAVMREIVEKQKKRFVFGKSYVYFICKEIEVCYEDLETVVRLRDEKEYRTKVLLLMTKFIEVFEELEGGIIEEEKPNDRSPFRFKSFLCLTLYNLIRSPIIENLLLRQEKGIKSDEMLDWLHDLYEETWKRVRTILLFINFQKDDDSSKKKNKKKKRKRKPKKKKKKNPFSRDNLFLDAEDLRIREYPIRGGIIESDQGKSAKVSSFLSPISTTPLPSSKLFEVDEKNDPFAETEQQKSLESEEEFVKKDLSISQSQKKDEVTELTLASLTKDFFRRMFIQRLKQTKGFTIEQTPGIDVLLKMDEIDVLRADLEILCMKSMFIRMMIKFRGREYEEFMENGQIVIESSLFFQGCENSENEEFLEGEEEDDKGEKKEVQSSEDKSRKTIGKLVLLKYLEFVYSSNVTLFGFARPQEEDLFDDERMMISNLPICFNLLHFGRMFVDIELEKLVVELITNIMSKICQHCIFSRSTKFPQICMMRRKRKKMFDKVLRWGYVLCQNEDMLRNFMENCVNFDPKIRIRCEEYSTSFSLLGRLFEKSLVFSKFKPLQQQQEVELECWKTQLLALKKKGHGKWITALGENRKGIEKYVNLFYLFLVVIEFFSIGRGQEFDRQTLEKDAKRKFKKKKFIKRIIEKEYDRILYHVCFFHPRNIGATQNVASTLPKEGDDDYESYTKKFKFGVKTDPLKVKQTIIEMLGEVKQHVLVVEEFYTSAEVRRRKSGPGHGNLIAYHDFWKIIVELLEITVRKL